MTLDKPKLATRKPTGLVPAPFVLLEGEEKAGKTWAAVQLSASDKVGATYFLDLGEGTADEYGAIPGADFEVLEHDGTYASVLEQVLAVKEVARAAQQADDLPVVLIIDTMSDIWDGLRGWANERAKAKPANQKKLADDPAAELDVSRNIWNDVDRRYNRLMTALLTFPGIVIGTARGKEISATDKATGQPYRDGRRDYRVEGQKNLAYQATVWVRMVRSENPLVIGARSVHVGIKPRVDDALPITNDPDNLLEWLIFDALRYEPSALAVRKLQNMRGGELTEDEKGDDQEADARAARQAPPATGLKARHGIAEESERKPPTLDEELARVGQRRQAWAAQSRGPYAAMARALEAVHQTYPEWTKEECVAEVTDCLVNSLSTTRNEATPDHYLAVADQYERLEDDGIRARHDAQR